MGLADGRWVLEQGHHLLQRGTPPLGARDTPRPQTGRSVYRELCSFPLELHSNPSDHPLVTRVIYQFPGTSVISDVRIQAERQTFLPLRNPSRTPTEAPLRPFHLSSRSRVFSLEVMLSECLMTSPNTPTLSPSSLLPRS